MNREYRKQSRIILICLLLFISSALDAAWRTTRFVVYQGPPVEDLIDNASKLKSILLGDWRKQEEGREQSVISAKLRNETESYLHEVAQYYEKVGFADPVTNGALDSLVTTPDGHEAIRGYVYKHPTQTVGAWVDAPPPCNPPGSRVAMNINTRSYAVNGHISDANHVTLAHELFHAIQNASPFQKGKPCSKADNWVMEGTADAMGHYLARTLRNALFTEEMNTKVQFLKVFGGRNYAFPLNEPDPKPGANEYYFTSSFWRHLAEWSYARAALNKPHPGSRPAREDYRYLVDFFKRPVQGEGAAVMLTWLNDNMRSHPSIAADLARVYAQFVASFADHVNTRIGPLAQVAASERQQRWLKKVFGGCESAGVLSDQAQATVTLNIRPNAARCFRIDLPSGSKSGQLVIQTTTDSKALLTQLRIGAIDGTLISPPLIAAEKGTENYIGKWTFPMFIGMPGIFIISNVNEHPASTREMVATFYLDQNLGASDLTGSPADSSATTVAKSSNKQGKPTRRERLEQTIREETADPKTTLRSHARRLQCEDSQPGKCKIFIEQQMEPAISPNLLTDNNTAYQEAWIQDARGMMKKAFSGARLLHEAYQDNKAYKIRIAMPRIDFGFTGSLSNATIWVNKAVDKQLPRYIDQGGYRSYPAATVTIEEYTPLVLRGSYSADLIDTMEMRKTGKPVIVESIHGRFVIPAPWEGDDRFEIDKSQIEKEMTSNMLQQMPTGNPMIRNMMQSMGVDPQTLCDRGIDDLQMQAMGFSNGCGSGKGGAGLSACKCTCDTQKQEESIPACQRSCATTWKQQCQEPMPSDPVAQLAWCRRMMTNNGVPSGIQDKTLEVLGKIRSQVPKNFYLKQLESICSN